jgi:hypothetical protein
MKRFKPLFFAFLTAGLFAFQLPATADGHGAAGDDDKTGSKITTSNNTPAGLPVNNNIVFLVIVIIAIGGKVITDKIRSARH